MFSPSDLPNHSSRFVRTKGLLGTATTRHLIWAAAYVIFLFSTTFAFFSAAVQLEPVSPLEFGVSVTGMSFPVNGMKVKDAVNGLLVASLPWVPNGTLGPPKRRMVTFLPRTWGSPMCFVDTRAKTGSCVDISLTPVTGIETSYVNDTAPVILVTQRNLTLVDRTGAELALHAFNFSNFTNGLSFNTVWHADYNSSSGEVTVYHHNGSALFADVIELHADSDGQWNFVGASAVRVIYAATKTIFSLPVPHVLQRMTPCVVEVPTFVSPSTTFSLTSPRFFRAAFTCQGVIPAFAATVSSGRQADGQTVVSPPPASCPVTASVDEGMCWHPACIRTVGPAASLTSSCLRYISTSRYTNVFVTATSSVVQQIWYYGCQPCGHPGCGTQIFSPPPMVQIGFAHSFPCESGSCADGRGMLVWSQWYQQFVLSTGLDRGPTLLLNAITGLGENIATVPLTCGSSELLVVRDNVANTGNNNAYLLSFVPPPRGTSFLSRSVLSLSIVSTSDAGPVVAACHATGCSLVKTGAPQGRPTSADSILFNMAIVSSLLDRHSNVLYSVTSAGKGVFDETILTVPGVPGFLSRLLLYLPPLECTIAVGNMIAGDNKPLFCFLAPDAVLCVPGPPNISSISAWVWLPPAVNNRTSSSSTSSSSSSSSTSSSTDPVEADVMVVGGNATHPKQSCYVRFSRRVSPEDAALSDGTVQVDPIIHCRVLPLPGVSVLPNSLVVHPFLRTTVIYAAVNTSHLLFVMLNYTDDIVAASDGVVGVTFDTTDALMRLPLFIDAPVLVVVRSFASSGDTSVMDLVPLPIGTTLVVTNRFIIDISVPRIATPFVPSLSLYAEYYWCAVLNPPPGTNEAPEYSLSCVDVRLYDPYIIHCEASSSRRGLVYRGQPFACYVFLAPPACKSVSFHAMDASWRQLLYNVTALGATVTIGGSLTDFRGTIDISSPITSFQVSFCVRRSAPWSCYVAVVNVADVDAALLPFNSTPSTWDSAGGWLPSELLTATTRTSQGATSRTTSTQSSDPLSTTAIVTTNTTSLPVSDEPAAPSTDGITNENNSTSVVPLSSNPARPDVTTESLPFFAVVGGRAAPLGFDRHHISGFRVPDGAGFPRRVCRSRIYQRVHGQQCDDDIVGHRPSRYDRAHRGTSRHWHLCAWLR